ncbi:MAG: hypothetical protein ABH871_05905 [Pseudomonadota bacterium]
MAEINIVSAPREYRTYLEEVDRAGNNNNLIDTETELKTAARVICLDGYFYCNGFFRYAQSNGFPDFKLEEHLTPGKELYGNIVHKIEGHLRKLTSGGECTDAADSLIEMAKDNWPVEIEERILASALNALNGPSKLGRMESPRLLEALAKSNLPPSSKERMIAPLLWNLKNSLTTNEGDFSEIPAAFGALAASDIPIEKKLTMTSELMQLIGTGNWHRQITARGSVFAIGWNIKTEQTERMVDHFIAALKNTKPNVRSGALIGISSMVNSIDSQLNPKLSQGIKLKMLDQVVAALSDPSVNVRGDAILSLKSFLLADLPLKTNQKIMGLLEPLLKSNEDKIKRSAVVVLSMLTENLGLNQLRAELKPQVAQLLISLLQNGNDKDKRLALMGLTPLAESGNITTVSEAMADDVIAHLKNDDEMTRNCSKRILNALSQTATEPLLSKIKNALKQAAPYPAPTVQSVIRTGAAGKFLRSQKYIATLEFSEVPKGAVSIKPMLNGYKQPQGLIAKNRATTAIWMDWRDSEVMAKVKFYDSAQKLIGETDLFIINNPDYKDPSK